MSSGWRPIVIGGIYWINDDKISMPPETNRLNHPRRMVLVVSGPSNGDPAWPLVQIMPLSSQSTRKTRWCVKINAGQGNVERKCWVRIPLSQPILKADLQDQVGVLPEALLLHVQANMAAYHGLEDEDEEDDPKG
ncbi:hypothetical protein CcI49_17045 [Frankia sp. CcI49]|uniref:type II toxin-antitoxin system PemK/MazF family toxin n=1 Tax=Frankia sp. CcI49 TaxID=1745382 RepID=UPI000977C280|nr:type II toxin-antitoxin system PemK/MazF family toxin [Frankia sp. CcI49]ONH59648.1 hypothetical protein CcI49_17045 [Frankia sp. CcI49]